MASVTHPRLFSQKEPLIEAWYWIEYSSRLKRGKTKAVSFFGKDLVLYREQGKAGHLFALDAYCPHMGAHLAEGKVEGEHLRCFFHHWKFEGSGACIEIPIQKDIPTQACVSSWPVQEKYGLIWLWPSTTPATELPKIPELEEEETDYLLGNFFLRNCHPHVVMINAIDEQHFYSVHPLSRNLAGGVRFEVLEKSPYNIQFRNETSVPETTFFTRLLKRFYRDSLTYWMSYWHGCIGSVIVGPDFFTFLYSLCLKTYS
jgi:phenylpropionate dioxygenase-like ring-hydroxylating dioxygenase large terminal subunit